jgi:hypothetical protein
MLAHWMTWATVLGMLLCFPASGCAESYAFTTIDFPALGKLSPTGSTMSARSLVGTETLPVSMAIYLAGATSARSTSPTP